MSRFAWLSAMGAALWRYVRSAPFTFAWLAVLFVTTAIQRSLTPVELDEVLGQRSTNIANLTHDPFRVLVTSLFWIDGEVWLPYLVLFCLFHVPAERWLGPVRWFVVGFSAHVIATYLSQGALEYAIRQGATSPSMVDVRDIGVSYFLAAIGGVLTYHIARPWRWLYLAGVVVVFGVPLLTHVTFTGIGHALSALIGLAWYPITRGCPAPQWNPSEIPGRLRARLRRVGRS
ncbi:hypothetical protein GYA93_10350 [Gordonia desulfuricans]|uniref:Uncharacterized protein n=1 Tax=Gordonia desulfuricans TaxID=89051 RepID=A0A7K3LP57_9ACTN|nr:rhomboid-like protein [Gordonia desulfuricans]NDK89978.1 hypothetical protein [Gordonia desulfuricans]